MSRAEQTGIYARWYHERGYQVLLPDLRGHGESEGRYVAMGWHDRMDLLDWISWMLSCDREAEIVLHGVSMGASAVLMTAGEKLPANVRAAVSDCAFTSAWEELRNQAAHRYPHLPPLMLLHPLNAVTRMRAGYGLREADALSQVKKTRIPVLFIHGDEDRYIPPEMTERLYEAKPGAKARLLVAGAGHLGAVDRAPEAYWGAVGRFLTPLGM
ncbi:MAG: alpha/beta hydrolase [Clostridia bacterium]|nr:alpha/beta hydrolase [Clostridia bacterium]